MDNAAQRLELSKISGNILILFYTDCLTYAFFTKNEVTLPPILIPKPSFGNTKFGVRVSVYQSFF